MASPQGPTHASGRARNPWISIGIPFALIATFGAVAGGSYWALTQFDSTLRTGRCSASGLDTSHSYSTQQTLNAAIISAVAVDRGMPPRAASIALATAYQESKLENIDYGDRDSVGLFQQRPSQGWGTVDQIMDPVYASTKFYEALNQIDGYENLDITVAAQKVQRSAYPEAYGDHEIEGRLFASALTGQSAGELQCDLREPGGPGNPETLKTQLENNYPRLMEAGQISASIGSATAPAPESAGASTLVIDVGGNDDLGWAVANWAVAHAAGDQIVAVDYLGQRWDRQISPSDTESQWNPVEGDGTSDPTTTTVVVWFASGS